METHYKGASEAAALQSQDSDDPAVLAAEHIISIPLQQLPLYIRQLQDRRDAVASEWWRAWGDFKSRRASLALFFHEDKRMGIQAALMKAESDPVIAELGIYSLKVKDQLKQLERVLYQLENTLKVRLALTYALQDFNPCCNEVASKRSVE